MYSAHPSPAERRPRIPVYDYPDLDLAMLNPPEVVNLSRALDHDEDEFRRRVGTGAGTPVFDETKAIHADLGGRVNLNYALSRTLGELPQQDLAFARDVYTAFALSPQMEDRRAAAALIRNLTAVDHDYGLSLWDQLVRDREPDVRGSAIRPVLYYRQVIKARNAKRVAAKRAELGLTSRDAGRLVRSHEAAERGENICDLGELALLRLTGGHPLRRIANRPR